MERSVTSSSSSTPWAPPTCRFLAAQYSPQSPFPDEGRQQKRQWLARQQSRCRRLNDYARRKSLASPPCNYNFCVQVRSHRVVRRPQVLRRVYPLVPRKASFQRPQVYSGGYTPSSHVKPDPQQPQIFRRVYPLVPREASSSGTASTPEGIPPHPT